MIRGTTPTHTYTLPFEVSTIKEVKIIYSQADEIVFCKKTEDCSLNGRTVTTTLTQEETFMLDCKKMVQIQIRVLTLDGKAIASNILNVAVKKCLDDEVLA